MRKIIPIIAIIVLRYFLISSALCDNATRHSRGQVNIDSAKAEDCGLKIPSEEYCVQVAVHYLSYRNSRLWPEIENDYQMAVDIMQKCLCYCGPHPDFYYVLMDGYLNLGELDSLAMYIDSLCESCYDTSLDISMQRRCIHDYFIWGESMGKQFKPNSSCNHTDYMNYRDSLGLPEIYLNDKKRREVENHLLSMIQSGPSVKPYYDIGVIYAMALAIDSMKAYFDSARAVCADPNIDSAYRANCNSLMKEMDELTVYFEYQKKYNRGNKTENLIED